MDDGRVADISEATHSARCRYGYANLPTGYIADESMEGTR